MKFIKSCCIFPIEGILILTLLISSTTTSILLKISIYISIYYDHTPRKKTEILTLAFTANVRMCQFHKSISDTESDPKTPF